MTLLENKKFVLTASGRPAKAHEGSYNLPVDDEIALVSLNDPMGPQDVRVYPRAPKKGQPKFQTVPYLNENYDPLHYVLLFPCGEKGWHPNRRKTNGKRLTSSEYYRHLL